jgi:hypothetical protein
MKKKTIKTVLYVTLSLIMILFIVIVAFLIISIHETNTTAREMYVDNSEIKNKPYAGYDKDLIYPKEYVFKNTTYSKSRLPIEEFSYKNYYIFLYRLPITSSKSLKDVLNVKYVYMPPWPHVDYYELLNDFTVQQPCSYSVWYKLLKPQHGENIYFTLSGQNAKLFKKTDNLYYYYTSLGSFSIRYNKDDTLDFIGEIKHGLNKMPSFLPIQIIFEKKNDHFYLGLAIDNEYYLTK